jgi:hypothetical protein
MKNLYRAKVYSLSSGHKIPDNWTWEYTQAYSLAQANRNMTIKFPYPKFFVSDLIIDTSKKIKV